MSIADQRDPRDKSIGETLGRLARQNRDAPEAARDYLECCSAVSNAFAERKKLSAEAEADAASAQSMGVTGPTLASCERRPRRLRVRAEVGRPGL